jgi:hypothetical protein
VQPNPHLQRLAVLVGNWTTQGTHPMLPGRTLHGHTTFAWIESGAFLLARTHIDEPEIPDGVAIIGTDDGRPDAGGMLYFDVRGVSREYRWSISGNVWTWSRDDAKLAQRIKLTISEDGRSIVSTGEMSKNGGAWEPDLQLDYTRVGDASARP